MLICQMKLFSEAHCPQSGLISVSLDLSQTLAYPAKPLMWVSALRGFLSTPSFHWYSQRVTHPSANRADVE